MKKQLFGTCSLWATCVFLLLASVSCTVDERYGLSSNLDATIGVGKGLSFPIGSTPKFFISELVDTSEIDVLTIDDAGNIVISNGGSFNSEKFKIDDISLNFADAEDYRFYDFKVKAHDDVPEIPGVDIKIPYIVYDTINTEIELNLNQDNLPKEVTRLAKLTFKEPVKIKFSVNMSSKLQTSQNILKTVGKFKFEANDSDAAEDDYSQKFFEVDLPDCLVLNEELLDEGLFYKNGVLLLNSIAKYNNAKEAICYEAEFYLDSLDLTKTEKGYVEVVDGNIEIREKISLRGMVVSDPVEFDVHDITAVNSIDVKSILSISKMELAAVEGCFEPDIEPVSEVVNLNLGSELDFLKSAYIDITDPRLALTFNNGTGVNILADASLAGYDEHYNELENTRVDISIAAQADATTQILIDRYGKPVPGWTNCVAPNINELIKVIPDNVGIDLNIRLDNTKFSRIDLGEEMEIGGSYELQVPLAFDSLGITYTYSMTDVFGNNSAEESEGSDMPEDFDKPNESDNLYDDNADYRSYDNYYDDSYNNEFDESYNGAYGNPENSENEDETDNSEFFEMVKEIRGVSLSFTVLNTIPVGLKPEIFIYDENGNPVDATLSIDGEIKRGNEVLMDGVVGEPVASEIKVKISSTNALLKDLYRIDIKLVGTGKGAINANEYIQLTGIALNIDDYVVLDLNS